MNNIYKVIWSKAKNCYVVASEIARSHTKSATGSEKIGGVTRRSLLASLMALSLLCGGLGVASAVDVVHVNESATGTAEVYTKAGVDTLLKDKADKTALDGKADKGEVNTNKAAIQTLETGKANTSLNNLDEAGKSVIKTMMTDELEKKADATNVYTKDEVNTAVANVETKLANKADKATTLTGYGITDAYTRDATDTAITTKVNEEKNARELKDAELRGRIDTLSNTVDSKVSKTDLNTTLGNYYTQAETDAAIKTAVDDEKNARDTAIKGEVTERNKAISDAIALEVTNRDVAITKAKTELQEKVTAEETARKEEDAKLEGKITENTTAINNEKAEREAADIALSDRIGTVDADGKYIKKSGTNNVSENLKVLDTQAKTNADNIQTNANNIKNNKDEIARVNGELVKTNNYFNTELSKTNDYFNTELGKTNNHFNTELGKTNAALQEEGKVRANADAALASDITATNKRTAGIGRTDTGVEADNQTVIEGTVHFDQKGNVSGVKDLKTDTIHATGEIISKGLDAGDGDIKTNGKVSAGDVSTGTLETTGNAKIGGDLTVDGKLNVGEIYMEHKKLDSTGPNYDSATSITADGISNLAKVTENGKTTESQFTHNEKGTFNYAKAGNTTDWKESTSNVTANGVANTMTDSDGNTHTYYQTATETREQLVNGDKSKSNFEKKTAEGNTISITEKDAAGNLKSSLTNKQTVDGEKTSVTNKDSSSTINQGADQIRYNVTSKDENTTSSSIEVKADGITNTSKDGTIINDAKDIENNATGDMTNTVGGKLTTTVTGQATEDFNGGLDTNVKGTENHTVTGDQNIHVTKNQTNQIDGNQENTIGGNQTTTVEGKVTEIYKSGQETNVTGDKKTTVTGKTSEEYKGGLETTVTGDEKHTVTGNQTTNVTGNISNTAKNITNEANEMLTDKVGTNTRVTTSTSITDTVGTTTNRKIEDGKITDTAGDSTVVTENEKGTTFTKTGSTAFSTAADAPMDTNIAGNHITTGRVDANELGVSDKDGDNSADLSVKAGEGVKASASNGTITGSLDVTADEVGSSVKDASGKGSTFKQRIDAIMMESKNVSITAEGTLTKEAKDIVTNASNSITEKVGDTNVTEKTTTSSKSEIQNADTITSVQQTEKMVQSYVGKKDLSATNVTTNFANASANQVTENGQTSTVLNNKDGLLIQNNANGNSFTTADGTNTGPALEWTNIKGNEISTGKVEANYVKMGYADVMKDLGVRGNAKVGQNLEVGGTSTLKGDVTMGSNATVKNNLNVEGITTTKTLSVTENATVGGTLDVTGKATFKDSVDITNDLTVGGNATIKGDVTAKSYKVGDKTYISADGINANDQKITNVADGSISEGSKDAVNGGQLYGMKTDLEHKVDKVGANAAAMANLHPMEFDPDSKWNIAAAMGNYGSETATAIGAFYRPNEDVMVNFSTAFGTGENMVGGGVSVRLGKGGNKLSREESNALKAQVNDLTARMDALLSVLNPNMSKDFPDVPENHWAYEAVSRLAGNDIVQGYPDGEFHGDRTMTRYEMAEIIYNALSRGAEAEKELVEEFKPELQAMAASEKATAERAEG